MKTWNLKKKRLIRTFPVLLLLCLLTGCEKEVNISPRNGETKLVIDGFIENDQAPFVVLTTSFSFFSKIDLTTLQNAFVHNAIVTVNDGNHEIQLREYSIDTGFNTSKYYFYTIDSANPSSLSFRGKIDGIYKLSVDFNGKHYEATTKIPNVKALDSMWAVPPAVIPDKVPSAMQLYVRYSDPDTPNNCIRYFTQRNGGLFLTAAASVYEDAVVNGTSFNLNLAPGLTDRQNFTDSSFYFFKGDTVTLRWCAIDRGVYNFWSTFEFSSNTAGNPFGTPVSVTSNISGDALGVWAGYGTSYKTLIIPK